MKLELVEKTPFDLFYADFLTIHYDIRKDILDAVDELMPANHSKEEKLMALYYDVYHIYSDSDWKYFFKDIGAYNDDLEFE